MPGEVGLGAARGARERLDHRRRPVEHAGDLVDGPAPAPPRDRRPRRPHVAHQHREQERRVLGREQAIEGPEGTCRVSPLDGARQIEDRVEAMLADDRADVPDADVAVVGPAGERRLARFAQQSRRVLTRQLHEEARRLVGDGQPLERRALAKPARELARCADGKRDDRGRRQGAEQPVVGAALTRGAERLVGQQHETGRRVRARSILGERLRPLRAQRLGTAHGDESPSGPERQRHGGSHDLVDAVFAAVEDLAPPRGQRAIREERAGHRVERVAEELTVTAVEQGNGRRLAALDRSQERRVVHLPSARWPGRARVACCRRL